MSTNRLSGGELPEPKRGRFRKLHTLILRESDVLSIHNLEEQPDGSFLYLIETPFATFPRFVIGRTDAENENPVPMHFFGSEWSANEAWARAEEERRFPLHVVPAGMEVVP